MLWFFLVGITFGLIGAAIGDKKEVGSGVGFLLGFLLSLLGIIILLCLKNKDDGYNEYYNYNQPVSNSFQSANVSSSDTASNADELLKWHSLKEKGAITEEEFERMKSKLL